MVSPTEDAAWTPKPGDKAYYLGDIEVTVVKQWYVAATIRANPEKASVYEVRYARRDNFGERASFAADRLELTPR